VKICGIELKANNLIFCIIDTNDQNSYIDTKTKKLTLEDDEDTKQITAFFESIKKLIDENSIEKAALKKRAKKGNFAGGAVTFKIEALVQLNGICEVELVSPRTISSYEKKNSIEFPPKLNKYQQQAYLSALAVS